MALRWLSPQNVAFTPVPPPRPPLFHAGARRALPGTTRAAHPQSRPTQTGVRVRPCPPTFCTAGTLMELRLCDSASDSCGVFLITASVAAWWSVAEFA